MGDVSVLGRPWRCVYVSEYTGPEEFLADEFTPQSSLKGQAHRVTEKVVTSHQLPSWRSPNLPGHREPGSPANPLVGLPPVSAPNIHQLPRRSPTITRITHTFGVAGHRPGCARDAVDILPAGAVVAVDTETMGPGADSSRPRSPQRGRPQRHGLDPPGPHALGRRRPRRRRADLRAGVSWSSITPRLTFPPLYQNGVMGLADIAKVHDTDLRLHGLPDPIVNKSLESLATKLGFPTTGGDHGQLFKANGLTTPRGFRAFDTTSPSTGSGP